MSDMFYVKKEKKKKGHMCGGLAKPFHISEALTFSICFCFACFSTTSNFVAL